MTNLGGSRCTGTSCLSCPRASLRLLQPDYKQKMILELQIVYVKEHHLLFGEYLDPVTAICDFVGDCGSTAPALPFVFSTALSASGSFFLAAPFGFVLLAALSLLSSVFAAALSAALLSTGFFFFSRALFVWFRFRAFSSAFISSLTFSACIIKTDLHRVIVV